MSGCKQPDQVDYVAAMLRAAVERGLSPFYVLSFALDVASLIADETGISLEELQAALASSFKACKQRLRFKQRGEA